jgi:hypothetical protein
MTGSLHWPVWMRKPQTKFKDLVHRLRERRFLSDARVTLSNGHARGPARGGLYGASSISLQRCSHPTGRIANPLAAIIR